MNALIEPKRCNLLLHCGAQAVERFDLRAIPTPDPTETWHPLPHLTVLRQVEAALEDRRLRVVNEAHALTKDGARYFGLLQIATPHDEVAFVIGVRNSHDKSFPAGLVGGSQVFVCDNLAFAGEVRIARKHTKHILGDFPELTRNAVETLAADWDRQTRRIDAYKTRRLGDNEAHDLVIRALDARVCCAKRLPAVLQEYRNPRHAEFSDRTVWSLQNAFTEVLKLRDLDALATGTQRLTRLLDAAVPALN